MTKITHDNWPEKWREVPPFTEVSEEVYNDMFDALPPIFLRGALYRGYQMGEPQCHAEDEKGRWRPQFLTFVRIADRYYYAGINFGGECKRQMDAEHERNINS